MDIKLLRGRQLGPWQLGTRRLFDEAHPIEAFIRGRTRDFLLTPFLYEIRQRANATTASALTDAPGPFVSTEPESGHRDTMERKPPQCARSNIMEWASPAPMRCVSHTVDTGLSLHLRQTPHTISTPAVLRIPIGLNGPVHKFAQLAFYGPTLEDDATQYPLNIASRVQLTALSEGISSLSHGTEMHNPLTSMKIRIVTLSVQLGTGLSM